MFKRTLKNAVYFFLNLLPLKRTGFTSILMYHSVGNNRVFFTVKPTDFEWQMDYLKKNDYDSIFVRDLVGMHLDMGVQKKTVAVTFDDGYEDTFLHAYPVLQKYRLKATLFLTTGYVGSELKNSQNQPLKLLTWDQIREMESSGLVDIQPHSLTHPDLTQINTESKKDEIFGSKQEIESVLNKKCAVFAYPRGRYDEAVVRIVKDAGFDGAVTVKEGLILPGDDPFRLKRNSIDAKTSRPQFLGKVSYTVKLFRDIFHD